MVKEIAVVQDNAPNNNVKQKSVRKVQNQNLKMISHKKMINDNDYVYDQIDL